MTPTQISIRTSLGILIFSCVVAAAETPEEKGMAVAIAADKADEGWGDWSAETRMILRNRQGQSSQRQMRFKALEEKEEGDKRLIIFDEPRDIKGTAFLVYTKKTGQDDQWLYLPALKRVKRISSKNQSGPFVGSEFAYEDLSSQEVEKYTYRHLREETLASMDCHVLERIPVDKKSGYSKQIAWIDKAEYRLMKVDYYDRKGSHMKTMTAIGYNSYSGNYWRAERFEMKNHQTGKSTDLIWSNYHFNSGIREQDFRSSRLKNVR